MQKSEIMPKDGNKESDFMGCFEAEKIISETKIDGIEGKKIDIKGVKKTKRYLWHRIYQKICSKESKPMELHFYLSEFADRTLTENEFLVYANKYENVYWKEELWEHNKRCPVLFLNTFKEVFEPFDDLIHRPLNDSEPLLEILDWVTFEAQVSEALMRFEKVRGYFPFCCGCEYDGKLICELWRYLLHKLRDFLFDSVSCSDKGLKELSENIIKWIGKCNCPKSIEEFKEWEANGKV
ncbi:MAG: hypothetical protein GF329_18030 [Candidatus Lokiarchaeota archaeon]|nr:hypothetical protein [Candidatus Lokiarchaeota archaeon]